MMERQQILHHNIFNNDATTYWARDLHITDLNNDERLDLFISSQGREVGGADGYKNAPDPRINPVWGEQNQLFIGSTNGWIERPDFSYPETVDFSHGSVVGNFTNKVSKQLIVNNLGTFDGYPNKYLIELPRPYSYNRVVVPMAAPYPANSLPFKISDLTNF